MPGSTIQSVTIGYTFPVANSLDQDDCLALSDIVKGVAPEWLVEAHSDPTREVSVMIIPPNVDDDIGPLLVVHKVASVYVLDQFRWDRYGNIGDYSTLDEVRRAIVATLLSLPTVVHGATRLH
jgi:hypothetical protein